MSSSLSIAVAAKKTQDKAIGLKAVAPVRSNEHTT